MGQYQGAQPLAPPLTHHQITEVTKVVRTGLDPTVQPRAVIAPPARREQRGIRTRPFERVVHARAGFNAVITDSLFRRCVGMHAA